MTAGVNNFNDIYLDLTEQISKNNSVLAYCSLYIFHYLGPTSSAPRLQVCLISINFCSVL